MNERPLAIRTLIWFGLLALGILAASPFLFLAWLLSKLILPRAEKLGIDSCYTWVWQQFKDGGSIIFTRSKYGWWGHVAWVDQDGNVLEWRDSEPGQAYRQWKPIPPLWFKGKVVKVGQLKREAKRQ